MVRAAGEGKEKTDFIVCVTPATVIPLSPMILSEPGRLVVLVFAMVLVIVAVCALPPVKVSRPILLVAVTNAPRERLGLVVLVGCPTGVPMVVGRFDALVVTGGGIDPTDCNDDIPTRSEADGSVRDVEPLLVMGRLSGPPDV